jgi:hypothetical protein
MNTHIEDFWVTPQCSLVGQYQCYKLHTTSIFRVEITEVGMLLVTDQSWGKKCITSPTMKKRQGPREAYRNC